MNLNIQLLSALGAIVEVLEESQAKVAKEALRVLAENHPEVDALVSEHGQLCEAHRKAAPPYTLGMTQFLACVEATDLTARDLADGFRPCIVDAGGKGPRYCYKAPDKHLHMGPYV